MLKFIRKPEVAIMTAMPKSTLEFNVTKGLFVPPINIGARAVAWIESEVQQLMVARARGFTDNQVKALVKKIVADRKSITA